MAGVKKMKYSQICRVCLRSDGELHSIADAIKPRSGTNLASIVIFYEFISEALTNDKLSVDQICRPCSNVIRRLYSLLEKTEKANKILAELKAAKIRLKRVNLDFKEEIALDEPEPISVQLEPPPESRSAKAENSVNVSINTSAVCHEDDKIELLVLASDHSEEEVIVQTNIAAIADTKQVSETQTNNLSNEEPPAKKIALDNSLDSVVNDLSKVIDDAFAFELSESEASNSRSLERTQPDCTDKGCSEQTESTAEFVRKCRLCDERFNSFDLEKHRMHHMTNPFEVGRLIDGRLYCLVCCGWHRGVSSLKNHAENSHRRSENEQPADIDMEEKTFQCLVCLRKDMTTSSLSEHMGNHILGFPFVTPTVFCSSSKYSCFYCSNKCATRSFLVQHILSVHGCDELNNCEICGLKGLQMREVNKHLDEFAREYCCLKCSFSFEDAMAMSAHEHYHKGGKIACDDCRLAYTHTQQLERHQKSHDILHKCPICKKALSSELKLKHHACHHSYKRAGHLATKELASQSAKKDLVSLNISSTEEPIETSTTAEEDDNKIEPEYTVIVEVEDDDLCEAVDDKEEQVNNKINSVENPVKNSSSVFMIENEQSNVTANHAVTTRKDFTDTLLTPVVENVNPKSGLVISQVTSGDMVIRVGSSGDELPDLQQKNLGQIPRQPIIISNVYADNANQNSIIPISSANSRSVLRQNVSQLNIPTANSANAFNGPAMSVIPGNTTGSSSVDNVVLSYMPINSTQPGTEIIQSSFIYTPTPLAAGSNYVPSHANSAVDLHNSSELPQNQFLIDINAQNSTQMLGLDHGLSLNKLQDIPVKTYAKQNIIVRNPQHNAVQNIAATAKTVAINTSGSVIQSDNLNTQSRVQRTRKLLPAPEFLVSQTQSKSKAKPGDKSKISISNAQQLNNVAISQPNERPRIFVRTDLMTTKSGRTNHRRN